MRGNLGPAGSEPGRQTENHRWKMLRDADHNLVPEESKFGAYMQCGLADELVCSFLRLDKVLHLHS